jgi:hypothetical protein
MELLEWDGWHADSMLPNSFQSRCCALLIFCACVKCFCCRQSLAIWQMILQPQECGVSQPYGRINMAVSFIPLRQPNVQNWAPGAGVHNGALLFMGRTHEATQLPEAWTGHLEWSDVHWDGQPQSLASYTSGILGTLPPLSHASLLHD